MNNPYQPPAETTQNWVMLVQDQVHRRRLLIYSVIAAIVLMMAAFYVYVRAANRLPAEADTVIIVPE